MQPTAPSIGYLAQVACTWEVLARKAGNVCPGREFPDLTVNDFLASAAAIAPIMDRAPHQSLGETILHSLQATRRVVNTNTNLGIVLLLAPLASVPLGEPLLPNLARILSQTTVEDSRQVYEAIRLAKPGGLGNAPEQDVHDEPTLPLRDVMELAMHRDMIAAQYTTDFDVTRETVATLLASRVQKASQSVERAIIEAQLYLLFRNDGDDLMYRKLGHARANFSRLRPMEILQLGLDSPEGRRAFLEFDAWLRAENHARNPGTTADLLAAALFVALRDGSIALTAPFVWDAHPFAD